MDDFDKWKTLPGTDWPIEDWFNYPGISLGSFVPTENKENDDEDNTDINSDGCRTHEGN